MTYSSPLSSSNGQLHSGEKKTIQDIVQAKSRRKLTCTTAYTYTISRLVSDAGFDITLVGDSLSMEIQGYSNTLPVTLEQILYHSKAVVRGNKQSFIVADMPFLSMELSIPEAVKNAGMLIQKAGVDAVKVEGGETKVPVIRALIEAGIPVMGHLGLHPQQILHLGKCSVRGKQEKEKKQLLREAGLLEQAGVFSMVLECIPAALAKRITEKVSIPTIGIGAGPWCDGQILVSTDLLGLSPWSFKPKFVKHYAHLQSVIQEAFSHFKKEVEQGLYPDSDHSYH